jgi:hypothetical protein
MLALALRSEENRHFSAIPPANDVIANEAPFASRIISAVKYRPKPLTLNTRND